MKLQTLEVIGNKNEIDKVGQNGHKQKELQQKQDSGLPYVEDVLKIKSDDQKQNYNLTILPMQDSGLHLPSPYPVTLSPPTTKPNVLFSIISDEEHKIQQQSITSNYQLEGAAECLSDSRVPFNHDIILKGLRVNAGTPSSISESTSRIAFAATRHDPENQQNKTMPVLFESNKIKMHQTTTSAFNLPKDKLFFEVNEVGAMQGLITETINGEIEDQQQIIPVEESGQTMSFLVNDIINDGGGLKLSQLKLRISPGGRLTADEDDIQAEDAHASAKELNKRF